MNIWHQILLMSMVICLGQTKLAAQKTDKEIKVGFEINALSPVDGGKVLRSGSGASLQLWTEKKMNKGQALRFALGYRQLNGAHLKTVHTDVFYGGSETLVWMRTKSLTGLSYLDVNLDWQWPFRKGSLWTIGAGLRSSVLVNWDGEVLESLWMAWTYELDYNYSFGDETLDLFYGLEEERTVPLSADNFNRLDAGIQFYLYRELLRGIQLKIGVYQGLLRPYKEKLWPDGKSHLHMAFSLGLSVRIF